MSKHYFFVDLLTKPDSFVRGFDFSQIEDSTIKGTSPQLDKDLEKNSKEHFLDLAQLMKNPELDLLEPGLIEDSLPESVLETSEADAVVLETLSKVLILFN